LIQASARRFVNPVKRFVDGIPKRYRAYRRLRQEEGKWYRKEGFNPTDLHPLELDVILLAILRGANDLLSKPSIVRDVDLPVWSSLKPVLDLYKNQILVDEATDFSPVQIACMAALSHPRIRSFFACGDFNQRLTTWGSRSVDQMKWVFPEIEVKEITVSYRQSRQLNELARALIQAAGGTGQGATLPEHVDSEGVAPALLEGASDPAAVVDWLAQRIREIERFLGQLPSIAIFVESEAEVQPIADALNAALADENTQVVACPKGQVMGQDNDVRVFDVEHIKGLEFEAVFFIGIDRLASLHPQLFDKYLYVGTTRAAAYLGMTCDDALPTAISTLRPMFVSDWMTP
jgi:superfamily I DNA/RNA helicase